MLSAREAASLQCQEPLGPLGPLGSAFASLSDLPIRFPPVEPNATGLCHKTVMFANLEEVDVGLKSGVVWSQNVSVVYI